jgi:hypothetical protein
MEQTITNYCQKTRQETDKLNRIDNRRHNINIIDKKTEKDTSLPTNQVLEISV